VNYSSASHRDARTRLSQDLPQRTGAKRVCVAKPADLQQRSEANYSSVSQLRAACAEAGICLNAQARSACALPNPLAVATKRSEAE